MQPLFITIHNKKNKGDTTMNVIVLYAKANLGKTTTLKKTIRVLLEKV